MSPKRKKKPNQKRKWETMEGSSKTQKQKISSRRRATRTETEKHIEQNETVSGKYKFDYNIASSIETEKV